MRTGTLSPEAVLAQDIMREALEESVLARIQHPYNYDVGVSASIYLYPDLDTEWVQKLFISHSDRGKLDARLKRDLPSCSFYAFCDLYGILIPQLWEESALRFKFMVDPVFASGPLPLDPALTAQPAALRVMRNVWRGPREPHQREGGRILLKKMCLRVTILLCRYRESRLYL
ncbi:hypothetical protein GGS23DRAFT_459345 [Durotheca rogersii]|uniref:uncharacterized protein n=1 Tax=Durotheca rogersii TaxID=419775 RepID=UPI0022210B76|nr:uncharacterized protein GGS23DRAFT_459345 [Durotheca rogersii]KAI5864684.1 hypothetical protein GGS23DRAFT_459345 [Durotheca rogersii]